MHPILIDLNFYQLHTYGLMAALGFLAAWTWIKYESTRQKLPVEKIQDLAFLVIISGIIGSRILYLITNPQALEQSWWNAFKIWQGGLVWYGGFLTAILAMILYCRHKKLPFWKVTDLFIPGVALGHAFGRLGCLAAGCCHGLPAPADAWYAIVFDKIESTLAPTGIHLYPTQLMEASAEFLIFLFLIFVVRKRKIFEGQLFLVYLILYSILRSTIEVFRGDLDRRFLFESWLGQRVSTSQFISGILILLSLVSLGVILKSSRRDFKKRIQKGTNS